MLEKSTLRDSAVVSEDWNVSKICKGNKSELCCINRGLRIDKIALCEGAAASETTL